MQTNATKRRNGNASNDDELKECLLCGHLTEANPRALHAQREGGASHGLIEAKAFICRNCLTETDGWVYNQVRSQGQDRNRDDESDGAEILTDGGQTTEDYIDLGERYDQRFDRPDDCLCAELSVEDSVCSYCLQEGFGTPNPEGDQ